MGGLLVRSDSIDALAVFCLLRHEDEDQDHEKEHKGDVRNRKDLSCSERESQEVIFAVGPEHGELAGCGTRDARVHASDNGERE